MKTVLEPDFSHATTVLAKLFAEGGRLTTNSQGLSLGIRIAALISAGSSVKVSLEGITEFHGRAVHSMLSEVFSIFGVDHVNRMLLILADRSAPYALGLPLHVSEAVAHFREQEQKMPPQPVTPQVLGSDGEAAAPLTILPKPHQTKEPETFGAPPAKNEVEEVLESKIAKYAQAPTHIDDVSGESSVRLWDEDRLVVSISVSKDGTVRDITGVMRPREESNASGAGNWQDKMLGRMDAKCMQEATAARIKVEKSQEAATYEVDIDEKFRLSEWEEFVRWANSGLGVKTLGEHDAAWKAWQLRAAIQRGEVEASRQAAAGARRDKRLALVWVSIVWAGVCAVIFWRK